MNRGMINLQIREIISNLTEIKLEDIPIDVDLEQAAFDSFDKINLQIELETLYDIVIMNEDFEKLHKIKDIEDYLLTFEGLGKMNEVEEVEKLEEKEQTKFRYYMKCRVCGNVILKLYDMDLTKDLEDEEETLKISNSDKFLQYMEDAINEPEFLTCRRCKHHSVHDLISFDKPGTDKLDGISVNEKKIIKDDWLHLTKIAEELEKVIDIILREDEKKENEIEITNETK